MDRVVLAIAMWVLCIIGVIGAVLAVIGLGGGAENYAKAEAAVALALTGAGLLAFLWSRSSSSA